MSFFRRAMRNQSGVSLAFVTVTTTVIISSIAYLVITLIPRLRDENKKIKNFVNYRMFVTSLNDYVVHSLREGWCLKSFGSSVEAFKGVDRKVVVSDLLIAEDRCKQGAPMEEIVTYEANLERILWNTDVVGTDAPGVSPANTIIGINQARRALATGPKPELLTREKVMTSQFTFRMTDKVLADMSGEHPLFVIAKSVRNCLEAVDIKIDLVKDIEGVPVGNERKLKVEVVGKIYSAFKKPSCAGIRQMQSAAFYTFYPRSLNTFSLVKYGDLPATLFHEYHGPVYVAGDVRLPEATFDRKRSSVFYGSLVLGYKSAKETGKIVTAAGEDYSFTERGDPVLTKQDQYPGFRGFIGGVQLDSKEDRGFYNLFDYTAGAASGVAELEMCIAESKIYTNPSYTAGSVLAFRTDENRFDMARFNLGFTRKNRFRPSIFAPTVMTQPEEDYRFFKFKVLPEPMDDDLQTLGQVLIRDGRGREYGAYMGAGSSIQMELDLEKMKMRRSDIENLITNVRTANKDTWRTVIPPDHVLARLDEFREFLKRADDLADECDDRASRDCEVLGYNVTCEKIPVVKCDYNYQEFQYKKAKDELIDELEDVRNVAGAPGEPTFTAALTNVPDVADPFNGKMKTVLNIKTLTFSVSPKWRSMIRYYMNDFTFDFTPDHYSTSSRLRFAVRLNTAGDLVDNVWRSSRWRDARDGDDIDYNRLNPDLPRDEIIKLDCPEGIGMADWDLDMSSSANFSWNYANTPAGTQVDNVSHESLPEVIFTQTGSQREGHAASTSKSIVRDCIVPPDRTHIYGFYVCERLLISPGRSAPLYMIGTFIVKDLINTNTTVPVYWHSIWDAKVAHFILSDLKNGCGGLNVNISWKDLMSTPAKEAAIKNCGALDLVSNGPNNFMWTTVDPEIGLANPGDVMTSQKVKRVQRWLIKEDSRSDIVR